MFLEFEGGDQSPLAQGGDVVFVGVADFSDESVQSQSFQEAADLSALFPGEYPLEQSVAQSADVIFSAQNGQQDAQVAGGEEVEPAIAAVLFVPRGTASPSEAGPGTCPDPR